MFLRTKIFQKKFSLFPKQEQLGPPFASFPEFLPFSLLVSLFSIAMRAETESKPKLEFHPLPEQDVVLMTLQIKKRTLT